MSKNPNIHLSCGEFAKVTGTTKETLFHYDETGILVPDFRDDNGYRYYSIFQIEFFQVICMLKELGMSLKDIKRYLDRKSPTALITLLQEQRKLLLEKLLHLTKMRQLIDEKIAITNTALLCKDSQISVEDCVMARLAITPFEKRMDDRGLMLQMAKHFKACEEQNVYSAYAIGEVLPLSAARKNQFDFNCYSYCYNFVEKDYCGENTSIKPAGKYLTLYSYNGYERLPNAYAKLLAYADDMGYTLAQDIYEDVMLDELSVSGYSEYMLRLSVRII